MSDSLITLDVGNSFLHAARYSRHRTDARGLPSPLPWRDAGQPRIFRAERADDRMLALLPETPHLWFGVSVNHAREADFAAWLQRHRPHDAYRRLQWTDFDLEVDVEFPHRVGLDRLAAACAANALRPRNVPAIIVDAGTAVTVDLVDGDGVFRGGVIFPGLHLLARSLHEATETLPLVPFPDGAPSPLGRNTEAAIQSGLYFGAAGALRGLVEAVGATQSDFRLFVTGGGVVQAALHMWRPVFLPDLVLQGVALAARRRYLPSPDAA